MDDDDFFIENLFEKHQNRKKKVDSKDKGGRGERELCKILAERFNKPFSKTLGSGNRWASVAQLPEHAKQTLFGDICIPEGFLFTIEAKNGYQENISGIHQGMSDLDSFIEQSLKDAERTARKPLICWKRSRRPWLAFIRLVDATESLKGISIHICYRNWLIVLLDDLLKEDDSFFFDQSKI